MGEVGRALKRGKVVKREEIVKREDVVKRMSIDHQSKTGVDDEGMDELKKGFEGKARR